MSLFQISITEQSIIFNHALQLVNLCLDAVFLSDAVFVAFSAFAGMTIPYPKREFLNDDDSDSKSSAAKVMECHLVNLSNTQQRECNAIKMSLLHYSDPTSDCKIMTLIQHLTKSCKVFATVR